MVMCGTYADMLVAPCLLHHRRAGGREQGRLETALEFFLQSLVVYELELGEEDLKTAAMYNKLATVMASMDEPDHALEYV